MVKSKKEKEKKDKKDKRNCRIFAALNAAGVSSSSNSASSEDYAYTGGGPDGDLVGLAGKRVAVVGTGASAVQIVPPVADACGHLFVFQRTPSSVSSRNNLPTDPEWAAKLRPGWARRRRDNFTSLLQGEGAKVDLVNDGWTDHWRAWLEIKKKARTLGRAPTDEDFALLEEEADMRVMNRVRARVDRVVKDPATAEALKPYYRQLCKRPCFHDEYLETFNRPNVTLVDTVGRGVEALTARGLLAGGVAYEVDCVIFATGFEVGMEFTRRPAYAITGRDALALGDAWSQGVRTLHGQHVHGFPNLFFQQPVQGASTANVVHSLDELAINFACIIGQALGSNARTVEATIEAQDSWVEYIHAETEGATGLYGGADFHRGCTPGFYNDEGKLEASPWRGQTPHPRPMEFFRFLRTWRRMGMLGLNFSSA